MAPQEGSQDAAELLFGSILKSVVEDPRIEGRYKNAEESAEEVDPPLQEDMVSPLRPLSGASAISSHCGSTVRAYANSSASSTVNQLAAAEVVGDLLEEGIDRRAREVEAEQQQCPDTDESSKAKSKAYARLSIKEAQEFASDIVGRAVRTSSTVVRRNSADAAAGPPFLPGSGTAPAATTSAPSPPPDIEDVRKRAREALLSSINNGTFRTAVDEVAQQDAMRTTLRLMAKARSMLTTCAWSGQLAEQLKGPEQAFKKQFLDLLVGAADSGDLEGFERGRLQSSGCRGGRSKGCASAATLQV
jgi:hypothetical protein